MRLRRANRATLPWVLVTLAGTWACAHRLPSGPGAPPVVPESPATPAVLAPPPASPRQPATGVPAHLRDRASSLTLAEVVDVALRNSPLTRETWARALSAAAELGEKRAAYYPDLDLNASISRSKQAAVGGRFTFQTTVYGPSLGLNYLLLDFGGRRGEAEEALQALRAADWTHNATIQDVVLGVQVSYYGYLDAKAQLLAAEANVQEAEANLEAATVRKEAGVATVADVLQAKTASSQAELLRQGFDGQVRTLLGALATSMGLPANTAIDVGVLPEEPPLEEVGQAVSLLIDEALTRRPDLAAARARVLEEAGQVQVERSNGLPTLELAGSANRTYYDPSTFAAFSNNWSVALLFRFPFFNGFEKAYAVRRAEADRDAAQAQSDRLEQQVIFEVWRSYYDLQTAAKRVKTSRDLLQSAEESEQVALARYKEGVGSILDLLTAQSSLALARAQEIEARSDWFVAVARLARDTGALGPAPGAPLTSGEIDAP